MRELVKEKLFPILLIGSLSMLLAEVFSGASQTWFIEGWGLLLTFPLYLAHVLFFLWLAFRLKKISLSHLYLFGVLFGLYESWITKVLWEGYMDSAGPGLGTFLGVAVVEFPILVFFWHPVMSFILPVLVFEILTGQVHLKHMKFLKKSRDKTALIIVFLIAVSTFIANGNNFDLVSSNLSLVGTLLIVLVLYYLSRGSSLQIFNFDKIGFVVLSVYLFLLYVITFVFLLPERIPDTVLPYISVIFFYILTVFLILRSEKVSIKFIPMSSYLYNGKEILLFAVITVVATNVMCVFSDIASVILTGTYFVLMFVGVGIFFYVMFQDHL